MDDIDQYAQHARMLVGKVIEDSLEKIAAVKKNDNHFNNVDISSDVPNISWLSIAQFTAEAALEKINDFIQQTWEYHDSWLYCIDYLGVDEKEFSDLHHFRVKWSEPTRRRPVPRATACVYFTFDVSKIKPVTSPVNVYYVFESNRLVHRPGQSRFRERWLKDIIESKVILMESIDF